MSVRAKTRAFHDLAGFIVHCEANYLLLAQLLPVHGDWTRREYGMLGGIRLCCTKIESSPYTEILHVTIEHADLSQDIQQGRFVRLYHDLRVAEVLADRGGKSMPARHPYPNPHMLQPDEKFRANEHLGEWLKACVKHCPAPAKTPAHGINSNRI